MIKFICFLFVFNFLVVNDYFSQSYRGLNNDGIESFKKKKYSDAEVNFKKSIEKDKNRFEGHYNLGDAIYKQERFDESAKYFQNSLNKTNDKELKSKAWYNLGNSLLKAKKIQESIAAYKNSLKLNPSDKEAKYNLSYALNLMKQNQNKNKNQNKDDKNQKDKNQQQQQQNKNDDKNQNKQQQKDKQQSQQQNQKQKVKKEEAERILDALKKNQKDLQKELRKLKAKSVYTDKDW